MDSPADLCTSTLAEYAYMFEMRLLGDMPPCPMPTRVCICLSTTTCSFLWTVVKCTYLRHIMLCTRGIGKSHVHLDNLRSIKAAESELRRVISGGYDIRPPHHDCVHPIESGIAVSAQEHLRDAMKKSMNEADRLCIIVTRFVHAICPPPITLKLSTVRYVNSFPVKLPIVKLPPMPPLTVVRLVDYIHSPAVEPHSQPFDSLAMLADMAVAYGAPPAMTCPDCDERFSSEEGFIAHSDTCAFPHCK